MYTLYSLPAELQLKIIKGMTPEALFKLAAETTPKANGTPRFMFEQARIELFRRRGVKAGKFQYKLLGSWHKHWNLYQKVSFIKSDEEREEWISLLKNAIKDPEIPVDDKCRFSSFINKLIGATDKISPRIIQSNMGNLEATYYHSNGDFQLIISELIPDDEISLINTLTGYLASQFPAIRHSAIEKLASIGTLASQKVKEDIITLLLRIQEKNEWYFTCAQLNGIAGLINSASKSQKKVIHELLLAYCNHDHHWVLADAITCMAELSRTATQDQINEMVNPLCKIIDDINVFLTENQATKDFVRISAIQMLSNICANLKENGHIISALIRYLSNQNNTIISQAAEALAKLMPYTSQTVKDEIAALLEKKIKELQGNDFDTMMPLIIYASKTKREEIANYVMSKADHPQWNARLSIIRSLGVIYKTVSGSSRNNIILTLIKRLDDENSDVQASSAQVLSRLIQDATPEQTSLCITAIKKALKYRSLLSKLSHLEPQILSSLAAQMEESDREELSKRIISIVESNEILLYGHLFISLAPMLKHLTQSTRHELIERLLITYNRDHTLYGLDLDRIVSLGSVYQQAANNQQEKIFALLIKAVPQRFSHQGNSIAGVIAAQMQHFTNDQLNHFVQLNEHGETPWNLRLKLIAQTQINLNNYRQVKLENQIESDPTVDVRRLFGNNS